MGSICAWCTRQSEEGIRSFITGVTSYPLFGCDLPYTCWELNPDPLQEQQELLTAELLFPALYFSFNLFRVGFLCSVKHGNILVVTLRGVLSGDSKSTSN